MGRSTRCYPSGSSRTRGVAAQHASLSRWRSPVRIRSGPPSSNTPTPRPPPGRGVSLPVSECAAMTIPPRRRDHARPIRAASRTRSVGGGRRRGGWGGPSFVWIAVVTIALGSLATIAILLGSPKSPTTGLLGSSGGSPGSSAGSPAPPARPATFHPAPVPSTASGPPAPGRRVRRMGRSEPFRSCRWWTSDPRFCRSAWSMFGRSSTATRPRSRASSWSRPRLIRSWRRSGSTAPTSRRG